LGIGKHIAGQAVVFTQMQASTLASDYACGVLAPMLQDCQGVIEFLINSLMGNDSGDTTHYFLPEVKSC
jgi:hypothetical protein